MKTFARLSLITSAFAVMPMAFAQIDQITGQTFGSAYASQDFEVAFNAYDVAAIDDFNINGPVTVTMVEAMTAGWNGFTSYSNVTGWRVEIYSSVAAGAASTVGDVYSALITSGVTTPGGTSGLVSIPTNFNLNAGTYYLGVMAVLDFGTGGQLGINDSTGGFPAGANAWQVNPGGGFGAGTSFQPLNSQGQTINLAYRMTSAPVPEPATLAVLGLGAAALIRRRRAR